jgi:hypothetical protein
MEIQTLKQGKCSLTLDASRIIQETQQTDLALDATTSLVCKQATDFYKLILYPATLLKLCMISRSFLVEFFRSFRYKIMSYINKDSLTSYFPVYIPFISSSCLISLAKNPKSMLNNSRETGFPLSLS